MTPPHGIDLDQYRTQAKELLKRARAAEPDAILRIRTHHPEGDAALSTRLTLADTQIVLARELGFSSWTALKSHVLYRNAVVPIDTGDLPRLEALLNERPSLVRQRCHIGEWYESGYFSGAMLLHHVAGNPIRHPIPANIVDVTRLLLRHGSDPNARTAAGATTIGLLLTSKQASEAGVALDLADMLRQAGATDNLTNSDALSMPLLNAAPATAAEMVRRGARMDVRHAAGLGDQDALEALLAAEPTAALREEALAFACVRGQQEAVHVLLRHGATGDVLVSHGGRSPCTALHEAANRGHFGIVRAIVENGADTTVVEPHWGGTPAGWAEHGEPPHMEIADYLRRQAGA